MNSKNVQQVTVKGEVYDVVEMDLGDIIFLLPKLATEEASAAQLEMIVSSLHQNGELVGREKVHALGGSALSKILTAVTSVNGFDGDDEIDPNE